MRKLIHHRSRHGSRGFWGALLFGILGVWNGCTGSESRSPSDRIRVQLAGEPVSLDPALAEDGLSLRVLGNLMDGLVGYDGSGTLQHRLAISHELSKGGRRFDFTLRPGTLWSDGEPIRASHFVAGIRRALAPATSGKLAELLFPIQGAKPFHEGKSKLLPGVREEGGKLVIELERPAPYFLQVLSLGIAAPAKDERSAPMAAGSPVTGPYRLVSHLPERRILLERNLHYWKGAPKVAAVEFSIIRDESTGVQLFENGRVEILSRVPAMDFPRLRDQGVIRSDPFFATYFISFNCRKPPFQEQRWRRAVSGAVDREGLAQAVGTGEKASLSWIPQGVEGFSDSLTLPPVSGSGYRNLSPIPAGFDSGSRNSMVMEKVQADLKRNLGISLSLSAQDWKTYVRQIQADPPPIFRFGWLAPFRDPISHLQAFTSGNPNNYSGCSIPDYDRLVAEIEGMPSGPERVAKIRKAQEILVSREAVVAPLFHYVQNHAVSARVAGFRANPFGVTRFEELELR